MEDFFERGRAMGFEVDVGLDVHQRVGSLGTGGVVCPDADRLSAEFAELVLAMSSGLGFGLPLHDFEQGVGAFQLLYGAPASVSVGITVHLLVEELGAGYSLSGEV